MIDFVKIALDYILLPIFLALFYQVKKNQNLENRLENLEMNNYSESIEDLKICISSLKNEISHLNGILKGKDII